MVGITLAVVSITGDGIPGVAQVLASVALVALEAVLLLPTIVLLPGVTISPT
jgi:hypothetical protein